MPIPLFKMLTIGLLPSGLKKVYYKARGAKIGRGVAIGFFSILNSKHIEIGDDTIICPFSFINAKSIKLGKRIKIGLMVAIDTGEVEINDDSIIMEQVVIGAAITPRSKITIGKRVVIFPFSFLNPTEEIIIEDEVGIGGANYIFTHGAWQSILDGFPIKFGSVKIKKGAWLPWRVFVLPGVTIGEFATIGAGSVVNKDIPDRSLAAGVPAKVLKTDKEYIKNYNEDEKNIIMKNILNEFHEYLNFSDIPAKLIDNNENVLLEIDIKRKKYLVFYASSIEKAPASHIVISLKKIDEKLIEQFNFENKIWFDIGGKRSNYKKEFIWTLIRDFLLRYGIRFEIEG